jgi:hypothetical protein
MMCGTSKRCASSLLLVTCSLPNHIYDHYNCDHYDYRIPDIAIYSYYQHYDDYSYSHYDNDIACYIFQLRMCPPGLGLPSGKIT